MRKAYSYIRMSTQTQLKGDSLKRQLDLSAAYANANNLELVDTINGIPLKDIGISAFNGNNTRNGVLAIFLEALETQKIPKNSILLIESLDRLSRDKVSEAFSQFIRIINHEIEIVTLTDNQSFTKDIIDTQPGVIFTSLGSMIRANEESEIKSKRLSASWNGKRVNAANKILTRVCPAWIKFNENIQKFELIENRVEVVRLIFKLCINTCGLYGIAKYLNENHIPLFGKATIWHRSYIKKILSNRAVFGELQPYTIKEGKREKACDSLKDYYPLAVNEETFHLANSAIARRTVNNKGRKGNYFSNLFSGIVYCGSCSYKMVLRNRGTTPKGGKNLCCNNNRLGGGCSMAEWKLSSIESSIFQHLIEVNFEELIVNNEEGKNKLFEELEVNKTKIKNNNYKIKRVTELLISSDLNDETKNIFIVEMNGLVVDNQNLNSRNEIIEKQQVEESNIRQAIISTELKELIEKIKDNQDDFMFRSSVNQLLARQIEKITLSDDSFIFEPWDYSDDSREVIAFKETISKNKSLDEIVSSKSFEKFCWNLNRKIYIKYKTGVSRVILCAAGVSMRSGMRKAFVVEE